MTTGSVVTIEHEINPVWRNLPSDPIRREDRLVPAAEKINRHMIQAVDLTAQQGDGFGGAGSIIRASWGPHQHPGF